MAALVVFNNVLDNVLGFDAGLRAAVNAQGVDDLESLGSLKDKEIDTIADNIRRGIRPDANGAGGAPGFNINYIQTRQLKKAAYAERHLRYRMSQPWTAANQVNTPLLNELWQFRDYEEETKNHDRNMPEQYKGYSSLQTTKTEIESYLREVRGHNGTFLFYVIRKEPDPLHADNLVLAADSLDARMIKKAPHTGDGWRADNAKVAEVIAAAFKGTDAWAWVRSHCLTKDGRGAYQAFRDKYVGTETRNHLTAKSEGVLHNSYYGGEKRNYTFDIHCGRHKLAHDDLSEFDTSRTEEQKIRLLLKSIHDPDLKAAVDTVRAQPATFTTFDRVVAHLSLSVEAPDPSSQPRRGIAGLETKDEDGFVPEDRNYSAEEWGKLTARQRYQVFQLRQKTGSKFTGGGGGGKGRNFKGNKQSKSQKRKINKMKKQNKEMKKTIAKLSVKKEDDGSSSSEDDTLGMQMSRKKKAKKN